MPRLWTHAKPNRALFPMGSFHGAAGKVFGFLAVAADIAGLLRIRTKQAGAARPCPPGPQARCLFRATPPAPKTDRSDRSMARRRHDSFPEPRKGAQRRRP